MMPNHRCLVAGIVALTLGQVAAQDFPAPAPPPRDADLGRRIQRTMTLLATSTPEKRHTVRILFYGQSITAQPWWRRVADDLRRRFPHANLIVENRAIGGFASQLLVHTAEEDLYPYYPDLMIFHVYGANNTYEDIIRRTRQRTTAEVLIQTDHVTRWPPEVPDERGDKGLWWDHMMNHVFLPQIADRYGAGIADVRAGWLAYLKRQGLEPPALLSDAVHLNGHGEFLMAELVGQNLVYRPDLPDDTWKDLVRDYVVGRDIAWQGGKLTLPLTGNRVVAIAAPAPDTQGAARVEIDGQMPSALPECYTITRPTVAMHSWFPGIKAVSWNTRPLVEEWTARITDITPGPGKLGFAVSGSVTGPDGHGVADRRFVSDSGRVIIEPEAWSFDFAQAVSGKAAEVGFEVKWRVVPLSVDTYTQQTIADPAIETTTTLVQGLTNGPHTLTLTAQGAAPAIYALRVYKPPIASEDRPGHP